MDARRTIADLARRPLQSRPLTRGEALRLATLGGDCPHELLYWAHRVRTDRFGDRVRLCAIVPGKLGGCAEDCKWCAQSARYAAQPAPARRAGPEAVEAAARRAGHDRAASLGIVNSGRRPGEADLQAVEEAVARLRRAIPQIGLCASLGGLTDSQACRLAEAGIRRYNHNLETSRRMFGRMVTTHTYDDRLATLAAARRAGMSLCCGGIFGLGETWADRIDLALALRDEVRPAVVPLNFLHPIPGTPLEGAQALEPMEILQIIAVFRLVLPDVDLKIAGGREANLRGAQAWMFYAGGTSCIVGSYLTTCGRSAEEDLQMIEDLGLQIVTDLRSESKGVAAGQGEAADSPGSAEGARWP